MGKFQFYDRHGVEEFYLYDPDHGDLESWRRGPDALEEIAEMSGFTRPRMGLRFHPGEGADNLEIVGPDGNPFLTYVELVEQREIQRQRAEAAEGRAEAAEGRAEAERVRAERLAEKLRSLGVEPE
jgi:hypothetical protein